MQQANDHNKILIGQHIPYLLITKCVHRRKVYFSTTKYVDKNTKGTRKTWTCIKQNMYENSDFFRKKDTKGEAKHPSVIYVFSLSLTTVYISFKTNGLKQMQVI